MNGNFNNFLVCSKCGGTNAPNTKICVRCGNNLQLNTTNGFTLADGGTFNVLKK